eukprot:CAMPEP_0194125356 /NCGR_PEP_ID=MMETSP0150-20130528/59421_1 /TAXON_ID=122233 /ORGANISM="Chaetoceros debilis, Strain MM31A-1" /LENGTH=412 /DNA_ID=CAMNT_0038819161 /DNA_START=728 /DNA_END=1966 /DNA_ORIENTATION=-
MSESPIEALEKRLQCCKNRHLPKALEDKINDFCNKSIESLIIEAANFLHCELDEEMHSEDNVKAVIDVFPESLSQENDIGYLPIMSALTCHNDHGNRFISFIPLLAKEGSRLGVGGEGMRGGLLCEIPGEDDVGNALQVLPAIVNTDEGAFGNKLMKVLDELRNLGLMVRSDIKELNLLSYCLFRCKDRLFEYLTSWDPNALATAKWEGEPLIHLSITRGEYEKESFEMMLKAGMRHFPTHHGFLFRKYKGKTACEAAFDILGETEAMSIIRRCIPPGDCHSIVHRAADISTVVVMNEFVKYYPDEFYTRDANGRTLSQVQFHAELRRGKKTFHHDAAFFMGATDDEVEKKDPMLGLYPCMVAASGNTSDLYAVYTLLRRSPKVIFQLDECKGQQTHEIARMNKRQRMDSLS